METSISEDSLQSGIRCQRGILVFPFRIVLEWSNISVGWCRSYRGIGGPTCKAAQLSKEQQGTPQHTQNEPNGETELLMICEYILRSSKQRMPSRTTDTCQGYLDRTQVTYQPTNPYNLCFLVNPRNLNADSPSKNWVSGIALPADSRFSHPFEAISVFDR